MSGIILIVSLAVLFLLGVPVAFSMGLSSVLTMAVDTGVRWGTIVQSYINGISSFTVLAIPLFILAGKVMNVGGITDRLFGFARTLVGWLPGGLGHVNVVASVIFSGMSGSAVADVGGLGIIEIKAMDDAGFDHDTSCCITAASSCYRADYPAEHYDGGLCSRFRYVGGRAVHGGHCPGAVHGGAADAADFRVRGCPQIPARPVPLAPADCKSAV